MLDMKIYDACIFTSMNVKFVPYNLYLEGCSKADYVYLYEWMNIGN